MTMQLETIKNSAWIIGGKIVMFALSFGFITALANLVSPEVVGSYQYILSILTIASIATLPGMNSALVRAVARGYEGTKARMMQLKLSFGILGSLIAIAFGIFHLTQGMHALGFAFLIAAPFVPLTDTFSEMAYGLYQGRKKFHRSTVFSIIAYSLFLLPALGIMLVTDNLVIMVGSFFALQAAGGILNYIIARPANEVLDDSSVKLGFRMTGLGILRTIANNIDRAMVWQLLGPVAVATYTFAMTPMNKIEQLIPIEAIALPNLSHTEASSEMKRLLWKKAGLIFLAMIPVVVIGVVLAPIAFGLLFPKFPESIPLFQILATSLILAPVGLFRTSFIAWHCKRELTILDTASPVVRIICMAIGGILGGILGIVIGIVVSKVTETLLTMFLFAYIKENAAL